MMMWVLVESRVRMGCCRAWLSCGLERTLTWTLLLIFTLTLGIALLLTLLTLLALLLLARLVCLALLVLLAFLALERESLALLFGASKLLLTVLALRRRTVLALVRSLAVSHPTRSWAAGLFWGAVLRHVENVDF
jgi:hypothetical protein